MQQPVTIAKSAHSIHCIHIPWNNHYVVIIVCTHPRNSEGTLEEDMAMAEHQYLRLLLLFPVVLFVITSISVDIVSGQPTGECA